MLRTFLFLLFLVASGVGAYYWEQASFNETGPAEREAVVLIVPGGGIARISQKLAESGEIRNAELFKWGVRLRGVAGELKAGEYDIPAHASEADIAKLLIAGASVQHRITAAEGLTSQMIYTIIANDSALTGDAGSVPSEGTLLPETYLFTRGETREQLLAKMAAAQARFLDEKWPARASGLPVKSLREAITLASIVEKETAIPAERRHIAAVFINRLRLGMKLQSDPTIIYGITRGYPLGRGIRQSELARATPYNTYAISGLPPTPICNPGKDSVAAVLDPASSRDLYFVADGTGGHVFTADIAEHERNVARWRKIEAAHH